MSDSETAAKGGAVEVSTIYVSYVETPGGEGVFSYLPDAEAAAMAVETRSPQKSHVTRIQKISKMAGQTVIEILCFSAGQIGPESAREISQNAVDWLREGLLEEGHLRWTE